MADDPTTVQLGDTEYRLQPQRVGRIVRKLRLLGEVFDPRTPPDEITGGAYEALKVFIPDLAPEHELAGYTKAQWELKREHDRKVADAREAYVEELETAREAFADAKGGESWADLTPEEMVGFQPPEYVDPDPDYTDPGEDASDKSPTFPQIADALEGIYAVNGGRRLERLLANLVDAETLKILTRNALLAWVSTLSRSDAPQSGASVPTNSGTTPPTSPPPVIEATASPAEAAPEPATV